MLYFLPLWNGACNNNQQQANTVSEHPPALHCSLYEHTRSITAKTVLYCMLILLFSGVADVLAQPLSLPLKRPSQEQLEMPDFEAEEPAVPLKLPPLPAPATDTEVSGQARVYSKSIELTGNTVFTREELASLISPYENREITSGELQELRYALTLHYVSAGYINSGAIIPDQTVTDGLIRIEIVEGELTSISVEGNERLKSKYISGRAALGAGPPLNIVELGEQLQILQQNPRFERIQATLEPGAVPGEGNLNIDVKEARPYHLWLGFDNHQPPSVGGIQGRVWGDHLNLTGHGDVLQFEYDHAEGLDDFSVRYSLPVNARDTTLGVYYDRNDAEVVEDPFDELDIESDLNTFSLFVNQPFHLSVNRVFTLGLLLDLRESKTHLLGERFPFTPGTDNGKTKLTVVRFMQEWLDRDRTRVLAARSLFSAGIDAFDATVNGEPQDGKFLAWLGQFQLAERIPNTRTQLIYRADVQLANDSLPPMEQITIGGYRTVRGYRENRLVSDTGFVTSVELRVPVYTVPSGNFNVQVAPFADYGLARNHSRPDPGPDHISSIGIGLLGTLYQRVNFDVYYGHAFQDFDNANNNIQDDGWSFSLSLQLL